MQNQTSSEPAAGREAEEPRAVSLIFAKIAAGQADEADYRKYVDLWDRLRAAQSREPRQ